MFMCECVWGNGVYLYECVLINTITGSYIGPIGETFVVK